tara:strand:+ start:2209 stop:3603 length:1395 start_codon:yes stop_codon:yes gene_type:complete
MNQLKKSLNKIFFVGIGGSGMSGLAEVLLNLGYEVLGSDTTESSITERLQSLGIEILFDHKPENIKGVDMLVKSTAIKDKNPELVSAMKQNIPILERAELLSSLMIMKRGIAIAGTHGKTTTTSLLASIMTEAMLDPTFINGGVITSFATNAKLGTGDYLIAEADESDKSFLKLQPSLEIITNIDSDHLLNYENNFQNLEQAFIDFVKKLPFDGLLVACGDDPVIRKLASAFSRRTILYGFERENDYRIENYKNEGFSSEFSLVNDENQILDFKLNIPGRHNALNAAAAVIVSLEENISSINIQSALSKFSGINRRMEFLGKMDSTLVVDDYGHHPNEIRNTIETLRESFRDKEITMVFQPHRYSRTIDLYDDFVEVLSLVDQLLLLDIYPAGEKAIKDISSAKLLESIKKSGFSKARLCNSSLEALEVIRSDNFGHGGVLLIQGAGNISEISEELSSIIKKNE